MTKTRRQFMTTTALASSGLVLSGMNLPSFESPKKEGFGIKVFVTSWGFDGSIDALAKAAKQEGFDGLATSATMTGEKKEALLEALDKYNLLFGGFVASGHGNDFEKHLETYSKNLERAVTMDCQYINCHAGKEYFSFEQNKQLIDLGLAYAKKSGIPVYQETHRGRILFAGHICEQFMKACPDLRLTLDISHWCTVSESLLEDQKEMVSKTLKRSDHIHARVGFQEGAQVPDFRDPNWKMATEAHFAWWDEVVAMKKEAGEVLTVTPEFGPKDYMWTMPYTGKPLANQWEINVHMMNEWRKRYL